MAERPTPHSIAVCSLIALYSDPSSTLHNVKPSRAFFGSSSGDSDDSVADAGIMPLPTLIQKLVLAPSEWNFDVGKRQRSLGGRVRERSGDTPSLSQLLRWIGKTSKASKALLNDLQNTVESIGSF